MAKIRIKNSSGQWEELQTIKGDKLKFSDLTAEQKNQLRGDRGQESVNVGSIIWHGGTEIPEGYLLCNGAAVGRTTYPDLFYAIGTKYGAGDGSTTFNLPNLIDQFIQGSATAGTVKAAGLPNITGSLIAPSISSSFYDATGAFTPKGNRDQNDPRHYSASGAYNTVDFSASSSNPIYGKSNTVQPPAVTMLPCIKAYGAVTNTSELDASKLAKELSYINGNLVSKYGDTITGNLTVKGDITSTGNITGVLVISSSDARLKSDIQEVDYSLQSLKPYSYILDPLGTRHVGLIAQEVKEVIPEAVVTKEDGYYAVDYNAIVAALVGKVNQLENRLAILEK